LENQVEPLLTSLANSLYGNPAIVNALREAEKSAEQPMKNELTRALSEIDHGNDINRSLEGLASKVDSATLFLAVDGILICRETGGSLSRLLGNLSSVASTRSNLKGKIKALTSQQKTVATLVAVVPIGFVLLSFGISPAYQESLRTPFGVGAVLYAIISVAIGFVWLNKMTDTLCIERGA
jgi:tight adherence protein B